MFFFLFFWILTWLLTGIWRLVTFWFSRGVKWRYPISDSPEPLVWGRIITKQILMSTWSFQLLGVRMFSLTSWGIPFCDIPSPVVLLHLSLFFCSPMFVQVHPSASISFVSHPPRMCGHLEWHFGKCLAMDSNHGKWFINLLLCIQLSLHSTLN